MLLRCLKGELQKCRRSPVWLAFVLLPVFPAILGTGNFLANQEALDNGWYSLWSQHTLFSSMFFLPALLGVFCGWQWRLEHTDHNWNSFLTAPVPVVDLCLAKLILAAGMSFLAQGWIGILFVASGKVAGVTGPIPPELPQWLLCGGLGGVSVCAVQLYFSMVIRTFAPPPECPTIVTFPGSPPKPAMFCLIQRSASTRSSMPLVPVLAYRSPYSERFI